MYRGLPLLVKNKFIYRCERTRNHRSYWLCIRYKTHKCKGRIICQNNSVLKETEHCHMDDRRRLNHSDQKLVDLSQINIGCWVKSVPPRFSSNARKATSTPRRMLVETKEEKPDALLDEYIPSQRGYPLLVVQNYLFRKNRGKYWRCIRCTKYNCRSRVILKEDMVVNIGKHTHGPETAKIQMGRKIRDSAVSPVATDGGNFLVANPLATCSTSKKAPVCLHDDMKPQPKIWYTVPLTFVANRRGTQNLHYRGYVYVRKKGYHHTMNWVCCKSNKKLGNCRARVCTEGDSKIRFGAKWHNHKPLK
uniref:FLYWCH-type domain-containing protein n=1 Tax=Anopheles christyi TaxID=43041 RepID=A0A182JNK1_9DIPT